MDAQHEKQLMQAIYDSITNFVTFGLGGDQKSVFDKATTFIQISPLGQPINPNDFANMVTPMNINGDLRANEDFARLIDPVPAVQATYAFTSASSDTVYGEIVDLANALQQPDPQAQQIYDQATAFLYDTVVIKDFTGKETKHQQPSAIYHAYKQNQLAYLKASAAYQIAHDSYDLSDPKQQREWQANEPILHSAVDSAYDDWRSQGAAEVENALAAIDHSINNVTLIVLQRAKTRYDESTMASNIAHGAPWHLSYALPTDWLDANSPNFSHISFSTSNVKIDQDSRFTQYGGETSFSLGLWSVGGSFNHTQQASSFHTDATDIGIEMDIGLVSIVRGWLDGSVFKLDGWNLEPGFHKGGISQGDLTKSGGTLMTLLPTAFLVATNIKITGNWGEQDMQSIQTATQIGGGLSVGWGLFQISGQYETSHSHDTFTATYDQGTITVPGFQVFGWVSEIVNLCPPQ